MIDAAYAIQKAYVALLAGITYSGVAVPVYYEYAPDGEEADNFIVFGSITDNDQSSMNTQDSILNISVTIHTRKDRDNDGKAVAMIASEVLQRCYPASGVQIDLSADDMQVHSTKKTNDFTQSWSVNNQKVYIDRTIQFSHNIYYLNS